MNLGITLDPTLRRAAMTEPASPAIFPELAALVKAAGGDSSLHDFTLATDSGTLVSGDLSGNGNNFTQPLTARKPAMVSGGLEFAADDHFIQPISGGLYSVVMGMTLGAQTTNGVVIANQAAETIISYTQGSTIALVAMVDGIAMATRGEFFDALSGAGERRCTFPAIVMTGASQLRLGRGSSVGMVARVRRLALLNHNALGSNLAAALGLAEEWVSA